MNVMIKHYVRHEDAKPGVMNNGITKRILSYDDSLMVEELIFEQGAESVTHTHTPGTPLGCCFFRGDSNDHYA